MLKACRQTVRVRLDRAFGIEAKATVWIYVDDIDDIIDDVDDVDDVEVVRK